MELAKGWLVQPPINLSPSSVRAKNWTLPVGCGPGQGCQTQARVACVCGLSVLRAGQWVWAVRVAMPGYGTATVEPVAFATVGNTVFHPSSVGAFCVRLCVVPFIASPNMWCCCGRTGGGGNVGASSVQGIRNWKPKTLNTIAFSEILLWLCVCRVPRWPRRRCPSLAVLSGAIVRVTPPFPHCRRSPTPAPTSPAVAGLAGKTGFNSCWAQGCGVSDFAASQKRRDPASTVNAATRANAKLGNSSMRV